MRWLDEMWDRVTKRAETESDEPTECAHSWHPLYTEENPFIGMATLEMCPSCGKTRYRPADDDST